MRNPSTAERNLLELYLAKNEGELLGLLAVSLPENAERSFSPQGAAAEGRRYFDSLREMLSESVCVKWGYCERAKSPSWQDEISLACLIADMISTACGGAPAFVVAALLLKIGLSRFCCCDS